MAQYEVLCVGDAATDIFIRLSDAHIRTWNDQDGHWLDLPYGGKVPFDYAHTVEAGGNAANAAVGLARLGVRQPWPHMSGTTRRARDAGGPPPGGRRHPSDALRPRTPEQPELRALVPPGPDDPRPPRALRLSLAPSESS